MYQTVVISTNLKTNNTHKTFNRWVALFNQCQQHEMLLLVLVFPSLPALTYGGLVRGAAMGGCVAVWLSFVTLGVRDALAVAGPAAVCPTNSYVEWPEAAVEPFSKGMTYVDPRNEAINFTSYWYSCRIDFNFDDDRNETAPFVGKL